MLGTGSELGEETVLIKHQLLSVNLVYIEPFFLSTVKWFLDQYRRISTFCPNTKPMLTSDSLSIFYIEEKKIEILNAM